MPAPDLFGILDVVKRLTAPAGLETAHVDGFSWARNGLSYGDSTKLTADDWNRILANLRLVLINSGVDLNTLDPASPNLLTTVLQSYLGAAVISILAGVDVGGYGMMPKTIYDPNDDGVVGLAQGGTGTSAADYADLRDVMGIDAAISAAIDALIDGAPGALNTINELSAALGDDANFAATVIAALAAKATKADGTQALAKAGAETVQRTWRATDLKDAAIAAAGGIDLILEDQKSSGSGGGTSVGSTWTDRVINTKVRDRFGLCTLASNHFLVVEPVDIEWQSRCYGNKIGTRIWNVTDGVLVAMGMPGHADNSPNTSALSVGGCTLPANKECALQYFDNGSGTANGLGLAFSQGTEIYSRIVGRRAS